MEMESFPASLSQICVSEYEQNDEVNHSRLIHDES